MLRKSLCLMIVSVMLVSCSKPENRDISSREVFYDILEITNFKDAEVYDLTDVKNAQRYGIATDKIKDGYAVLHTSGVNADNLIVLRATDDKAVDSLEEAMISYINDLSTTWEFDEVESEKITKRVFKTVDKFILLYIGPDFNKAEEIFYDEVID